MFSGLTVLEPSLFDAVGEHKGQSDAGFEGGCASFSGSASGIDKAV